MSAFLVSAALDIFQMLIMDLDTEGRYLFLNAVANQLRYPNTHTHYFSFILLYLFAESNQVQIPLRDFPLIKTLHQKKMIPLRNFPLNAGNDSGADH